MAEPVQSGGPRSAPEGVSQEKLVETILKNVDSNQNDSEYHAVAILGKTNSNLAHWNSTTRNIHRIEESGRGFGANHEWLSRDESRREDCSGLGSQCSVKEMCKACPFVYK